MTGRHPLLEFVGGRYAHVQSSGDELSLRALELIAAACVQEWADLPPESRAVRAEPAPTETQHEPEPLAWTEDASKFDYDDMVPTTAEDEAGEPPEFPVFERAEPEPEAVLQDGQGSTWWGSSPQRTDTEPSRGEWEPPEPR